MMSRGVLRDVHAPASGLNSYSCEGCEPTLRFRELIQAPSNPSFKHHVPSPAFSRNITSRCFKEALNQPKVSTSSTFLYSSIYSGFSFRVHWFANLFILRGPLQCIRSIRDSSVLHSCMEAAEPEALPSAPEAVMTVGLHLFGGIV